MATPSADSRRAARKHVLRTWGDGHTTLKWVWTVVLAGAVIQACYVVADVATCQIDLAIRAIFPASASSKNECVLINAPAIWANYIVFMLTFFRFYVGDARLLDLRYVELPEYINSRIEDGGIEYEDDFIKALTAFRRSAQFFDFATLAWQATLFIFLARNIDNVFVFFFLFFALVTINVVWLQIAIRLNPNATGDIWRKFVSDFQVLENLTGSGAVRLWVRNNALCALAMIGCAVLFIGNVWSEAAFRLAFIAVMLTNCLVDIALARRFYFPEPDIRYKAIR
jgi:hypothetical protein